MRYVLFVCTHNAGRSQMARAFFERHGPPTRRGRRAGQEPAAQVWPRVVEVMAEVGIDLADRRPTKLTVEMQLHADWAITLACGAQCPYVPTTVEDWDIPDPSGRSLEEVRSIRDAVEVRVRELVDEKIDLIRSDRTAHQLRVAKLIPSLVTEFGDQRSEEEIRTAADAALADFQEVPVRSYVMTIANRKAREVLRELTPVPSG
jgi:protein-tyrosine-phosphatase